MNHDCSAGNSFVSIRKATAADADSLFRILCEYNAEVGVKRTDSLDSVLLLTSGNQEGAWIAWCGEAAAGCVTLRALAGLDYGCEIKRLYVAKAYRRKGIAKLLLDEVETSVRKSDLDAIYLDSRLDLIPALHLYRSLGYRVCEAYHDNPEAEIFMVKWLRNSELAATILSGGPKHGTDTNADELSLGRESQ